MERLVPCCFFYVLVWPLFLLASGCGGSSPAAPAPTGTVLLQGALRIEQTVLADLDRGAVWVSDSAADVWFEAVKPDERYLTPQNGARFVVVGTNAPGFATCRSAAPTTKRIPMDALTAGVYACGVTKQGHVVEFRVDQPAAAYVAGSPIPTLVITFTTYN